MAYVRTGYYKDPAMIEGSPITVCRRCGTADAQVVLGTCKICDQADWELCVDLAQGDKIAPKTEDNTNG